MYKLTDEQQAYMRLLKNLILVDFRKKRVVMRGYEMLVNTAIGRALQ